MNVRPQVFVTVKPNDIDLAPGEKAHLQFKSKNGTGVGFVFGKLPFSTAVPFDQLEEGRYYVGLYKDHELYPAPGQYNADAPRYASGEFEVCNPG